MRILSMYMIVHMLTMYQTQCGYTCTLPTVGTLSNDDGDAKDDVQ